MTVAAPTAPPAQTDLRYPFPTPPAAGTVIEVAPGVRWLRMPLPFALDHINLWLVRDTGGWAIVDCGFSSDDTRAAWEPLLAAHAPITRVIVTHYHPDHIGLAGWLTRRTGTAMWITEAEYLTAHVTRDGTAGNVPEALVALFRAHGLDGTNLDSIGSRGNAYRRSVEELPTSFRRITEGDTIDIGGNAWHVFIGHGHAPEHASLHCPALGVVISGDMLLPKISTNTSVWATEPDGDPVGQFLRSIRRYLDLPADTLVLPSHGLPFRGIASRVAALAAHHAARLDELAAACDQPRAAADVLDVLFRRKLDQQQLYFAMGEAIAHLNHLALRGSVVRTRDADGVFRFKSTSQPST